MEPVQWSAGKDFWAGGCQLLSSVLIPSCLFSRRLTFRKCGAKWFIFKHLILRGCKNFIKRRRNNYREFYEWLCLRVRSIRDKCFRVGVFDRTVGGWKTVNVSEVPEHSWAMRSPTPLVSVMVQACTGAQHWWYMRAPATLINGDIRPGNIGLEYDDGGKWRGLINDKTYQR